MAILGVRGETVVSEPRSTGTASPVAVEKGRAADAESGFTRAMRALAREIDVGETRTARASQLRSYDTSTLIALQVGIYRYTEAVDLASKIVDRATNAVRTVLQGGGH